MDYKVYYQYHYLFLLITTLQYFDLIFFYLSKHSYLRCCTEVILMKDIVLKVFTIIFTVILHLCPETVITGAVTTTFNIIILISCLLIQIGSILRVFYLFYLH